MALDFAVIFFSFCFRNNLYIFSIHKKKEIRKQECPTKEGKIKGNKK